MATKNDVWRSNPQVAEQLRHQASLLRSAAVASRLWENVMTTRERRRLGGNLDRIWRKHGTVGIWMKLRRVPAVQAIVEITDKLGQLPQSREESLLRKSVSGRASRSQPIAPNGTRRPANCGLAARGFGKFES